MQIADRRVPDTTNIQPYGCFVPDATGDAGVLVAVGGLVFGPDFQNHACGTGANAYTPWTPVSISPVTGSGAAEDPFVVMVVVDAGNSGLRLTETVSYTNGSQTVAFSFRFQNRGSSPVSWSTFLACRPHPLLRARDGVAEGRFESPGSVCIRTGCTDRVHQRRLLCIFSGGRPVHGQCGRDDVERDRRRRIVEHDRPGVPFDRHRGGMAEWPARGGRDDDCRPTVRGRLEFRRRAARGGDSRAPLVWGASSGLNARGRRRGDVAGRPSSLTRISSRSMAGGTGIRAPSTPNACATADITTAPTPERCRAR